MTRFHTASLVFCVCIFVGIESKKTGAPTEACETMTPFHSLSRQNNETLYTPQNTLPPFVLSTSSSTIAASTASVKNNGKSTAGSSSLLVPSIDVTLSSKDNNTTFKGFILQARTVNCSGPIVGTFKISQNTSRTMDCSGGFQNSATHSINVNRKSETLQWISDTYSGQVVFCATAVVEHTKFWVGIESQPITVTKSE